MRWYLPISVVPDRAVDAAIERWHRPGRRGFLKSLEKARREAALISSGDRWACVVAVERFADRTEYSLMGAFGPDREGWRDPLAALGLK